MVQTVTFLRLFPGAEYQNDHTYFVAVNGSVLLFYASFKLALNNHELCFV